MFIVTTAMKNSDGAFPKTERLTFGWISSAYGCTAAKRKKLRVLSTLLRFVADTAREA
jgi:hypothetical protein